MKRINRVENSDDLTAKQEKVLLALIEHGSVRLAVKETGISRTTIWHYQQLPAFQKRLREARRAMTNESTALIQRAGYSAAVKLIQMMNDPKVHASIQFAAARTILELAYRGQQLQDLQDSVDELKELVNAKNSNETSLRLIK
jgi:molybdenum-dependent DNA-binding transcriptional regulator ModE